MFQYLLKTATVFFTILVATAYADEESQFCISDVKRPDLVTAHDFVELKPLETRITAEGYEHEFSAGSVALIELQLKPTNTFDVGEKADPKRPLILIEETEARIEIFAIKDSNQRQLLCSKEVLIGPSARYSKNFRVEANSGVQNFIVKVTSKNIENSANLHVNARTKIVLPEQHFALQCPTVQVKEVEDLFLTTQLIKRNFSTNGNCKPRIIVNSPSALLISIKKKENNGNFKITTSFKAPNSYASFAPLCEAEFSSNQGDVAHFIAAVNPSLQFQNERGSRLWALDVESDCDDSADFEVDVREVLPRANIPRRGFTPPINPLYGVAPFLTDFRLSCFGELRYAKILQNRRDSLGSTASSNTFLDLVVTRNPGDITIEEKKHVESATLYALSTWRNACQYCGKLSLSLVRVNGRFFAESLLIEELNKEQELPGKTAMHWTRQFDQSTTTVMDVRVPSYIPMTEKDVKLLCTSPLFSQIFNNNATCNHSTIEIPLETLYTLKILLTNGFTSCDSNIDTIACEQYGKQVELNTRDFSYSSNPDDEVAFGHGVRVVSLDLVIAHEIGHWLGLGHVYETGALMSETSLEARCLGNADFNALHDINTTRSFHSQEVNTFKYR